jgi:hypothetical protein
MTSANGWMGKQSINETKRVLLESGTARSATLRTESASAGQIGSDVFLEEVTLCYPKRNGVTLPQFQNGSDALMDYATLCYAKRNELMNSQLSLLTPHVNRLLDTYSSSFHDNNEAESFVQIRSDNDSFSRIQIEKEAGEGEYGPMLSHAQRHSLLNASTQVWSKSVQRRFVPDDSGRLKTIPASPMALNKKPRTSTGRHRKPSEPMKRDNLPPSLQVSKKPKFNLKMFSSSGEHTYSEDSQKPAAALKQVGKPASAKALKESKFDARWYTSLGELKHFKQIHGHTIVPRGYCENPKLASWVRMVIVVIWVDRLK